MWLMIKRYYRPWFTGMPSMSRTRLSRSTRRLTPKVFLGVISVVLLVLFCLGWVLIRQELQLIEERRRNRLDVELTRAAETLEQEYQALQLQLATLETTGLQALWTEGVTLRVSANRIAQQPPNRLLYVPRVDRVETDARLTRADVLEFSSGDTDAARQVVRPLLSAPDSSVRAGALLRLARMDRKAGDLAGARVHYEALTRLSNTHVEGVPAVWMGWYGLCSLPGSNAGSRPDGCASSLAVSMRSGQETADADTYAFYRSMLEERRPTDSVTMPPDKHVLSEAVRVLDGIYSDVQAGRAPERGLAVTGSDAAVLMVWQVREDHMWAQVSSLGYAMDKWFGDSTVHSEITLSAATEGAATVVTPSAERGPRLEETLPVSLGGDRFLLRASEISANTGGRGDHERLFFLSAVLTLVVVVVGLSLLFVNRALRQEFEVARLQSEFVAAVSHEFRTPLTSMQQLTEMLAAGRVKDPERAMTYYGMLAREAGRLSRLVESLLNFGRMETGVFPYRLEQVDVDSLVRSVVNDFSAERDRVCRVSGHATELVRMDADMVALALWNLLDNAAKYSPAHAPIDVELSDSGRTVRISVTDRGSGIPIDEREHIFEKFVRGAAASSMSVKGTGLGLTLVHRIMDDHQGRVALDASSEAGSTFSLYLERI
jgi:signal transduction histidine kinase